MPNQQDIKDQRDRFLAFSFASSDLLIEVNDQDEVAYALGAAKGITGIDDKSLIGRKWLELFSPLDRPVLSAMRKKAKPVLRGGPFLVTLNEEIVESRKAVVTGLLMPGSTNYYITLSFGNIMMAKVGDYQRQNAEIELMDKETFTQTAQEVLDMARDLGENVDLTLIDLDVSSEDKERFGNDSWNGMSQMISSLLQSKSIDGQTAAEISEGKYSIIHEKSIDSDALREQISYIAQENDPTGAGLEVKSKTVTSDVKSLSDRDASKALIYTINEFERKGTDLTIENLNTGFKAYVSANAHKIQKFKNIIERLDFSMHFQPIVDLNTEEASHYEMLCRFDDDGDTLEWITFGEDIGMASEFDLAVCEKAINHITYKAGGTWTKFAINLSGQSVEQNEFFDALLKQLDKAKDLKKRLLFEITESAEIKNFDLVNRHIAELHKREFQVCLDDFGAGSASFQYLQKLDVDYVKIDGQYIRKILASSKDQSMVKSLVTMCHDLNIKVVAEYIEEEAQATKLRDLGVDYGQGYYFGTPTAKPNYK